VNAETVLLMLAAMAAGVACEPAVIPAPAIQAPAVFPATQVTSEGVLVLPKRVEFRTASTELEPEGTAVLEAVLQFLKTEPAVTSLRIEAHTDNKGLEGFVLRLQTERAEVVASWLVAHGIDCRRLIPFAIDDKPPCSHCDEGRRRNRHIEFHVAAVHGAPAFGPAPDGSVAAGDPCAP
jgi:outer membrane protein OmpA-like peptidoglycan-associated protein